MKVAINQIPSGDSLLVRCSTLVMLEKRATPETVIDRGTPTRGTLLNCATDVVGQFPVHRPAPERILPPAMLRPGSYRLFAQRGRRSVRGCAARGALSTLPGNCLVWHFLSLPPWSRPPFSQEEKVPFL